MIGASRGSLILGYGDSSLRATDRGDKPRRRGQESCPNQGTLLRLPATVVRRWEGISRQTATAPPRLPVLGTAAVERSPRLVDGGNGSSWDASCGRTGARAIHIHCSCAGRFADHVGQVCRLPEGTSYGAGPEMEWLVCFRWWLPPSHGWALLVRARDRNCTTSLIPLEA